METHIRGVEKRHFDYGGSVWFVENLRQTPYEQNAGHAEWLFERGERGDMLTEEPVEFGEVDCDG